MVMTSSPKLKSRHGCTITSNSHGLESWRSTLGSPQEWPGLAAVLILFSFVGCTVHSLSALVVFSCHVFA